MIPKSGYRFSERIIATNNLKRDDDSKKSHRALEGKTAEETLPRRRAIKAAFTVAVTSIVLAAPIACAQDYPSRALKMIVPVPAGGITDVLARILQDPLTRK